MNYKELTSIQTSFMERFEVAGTTYDLVLNCNNDRTYVLDHANERIVAYFGPNCEGFDSTGKLIGRLGIKENFSGQLEWYYQLIDSDEKVMCYGSGFPYLAEKSIIKFLITEGKL